MFRFEQRHYNPLCNANRLKPVNKVYVGFLRINARHAINANNKM